MIRNYSLDKNFRRLKVLNKHLAKYLHFFSFTYELYTRFTTARSIITSHRLQHSIQIFIIQTVVCVLLNTKVPFAVASWSRRARRNGKMKCEKYSLWVVVDYFILRSALHFTHMPVHINSERLENMEFHYTVDVIRRLCAIWEFFYVFISVDIIHFNIN